MPYTIVDNFSAGLDSRRHILNSKPGTLAKIVNAHITRGGEIEKRKKFDEIGSSSSDVWGLESTSTGVYTFTNLPQDGWQNTLPSGIGVMHLESPLQNTGTELIENSDSIVMSTVFGGKIFAIMKHTVVFGQDVYSYCIAYYDGVPIKDWHEGVCELLTSHVDVVFKTVDYFSPTLTPGYSAEVGYIGPDPQDPTYIHDLDGIAEGDDITDRSFVITGKPGIAFTVDAIKTAETTVDVIEVQKKQDYVGPTEATSTMNIIGGKEVNAKIFRASRWMQAYSMPGIRSIRVNASSATAADGTDLMGWNSTQGLKYNTFPGANAGSPAGELFWQIAKVINDNSYANLNHKYKAIYVTHPGWDGNDPADLYILAPSDYAELANGQLVQVEFDSDPSLVGGIGDFIDPSTIAVSPYDPTKFIATMGTMSGGQRNEISSISIDGVDILGAPVAWEQSHSYTANKIKTQIDTFAVMTDYTVSVAGPLITFRGVEGKGATINNKFVAIETSGNVIVNSSGLFSGGVNEKPALPQKTRVRYRPTGNIIPYGSKFGVTITGNDDPTNPMVIGASRMSNVFGKDPSFVFTYKSKVYVGFDSVVYFSALNDCTKWDVYDLGSGFIDMSNNFGGRERLTGCGVYQDKMVFFTSRGSQTWYMDPDPSLNRQIQVIENSGCVSADSVISIGSVDLIYLGDDGFRSLRARESTDSAYANDIGSPIDNVVIDHMYELTTQYNPLPSTGKHSCRATIDPIEGRLMMFLGDIVYVLSYFSGAGITAWSKYQLPSIEHCRGVAMFENKIYVLSASNKIYVYGGMDGVSYDDCQVEVEMPYLDASKPATIKEAKGVDMTCDGVWSIYMGFDHTAPDQRDLIATISQSSFSYGRITATGYGTHFGPRFVSTHIGKAKIANFIVHFDEKHSKHEAG